MNDPALRIIELERMLKELETRIHTLELAYHSHFHDLDPRPVDCDTCFEDGTTDYHYSHNHAQYHRGV